MLIPLYPRYTVLLFYGHCIAKCSAISFTIDPWHLYNGFILQGCRTDELEDVAKIVGGRLNDIAHRMNPELSYKVFESVLCETLKSQTGCQVIPVKIFRHALEMLRRQTSGWTYRSIMDMLFYGRKLFFQFLINQSDEFDELRLMDQFVEFFNVHCLPWIRSHGGWVS